MRQFLYSSSFFWGIMCWSFLLSWEKNCKKINKKKYIQKTKTIEKKQKKNPPCLGQDLDSRAHVSPEAGRSCIKLCRPPPMTVGRAAIETLSYVQILFLWCFKKF